MQERLRTTIKRFAHILEGSRLSRAGMAQLPPIVIKLRTDYVPRRAPPFPPPKDQRLLRKMFDELSLNLSAGVIERPPNGVGEWSSNMVVAWKDQKKEVMRMCFDGTYVSSQTVFEGPGLPQGTDCIHSLEGAVIFSIIDISSAFWSRLLHPDSRALTVFHTPWGYFQYRVLPMGLQVASGFFQGDIEATFSSGGSFTRLCGHCQAASARGCDEGLY